VVVRKAASGGSAPKETNMQFASSLIWLRRLVVVGSVVACAAASAVGASASLIVAAPDVVERYAATHDPNSVTAPDVIERYVTAHSVHLAAVVPAVGTARIVDDWYRVPKPVATPIATPVGDRIVDDSFRDATTVVASPKSGDGLDWGDFGIGAGAMLGFTLLVIGLGFGTVAMRHRAGKLGTS